jgi:adenylate cyclase
MRQDRVPTMFMPRDQPADPAMPHGWYRWTLPLRAFVHRCPFATFLVLGILLNIAGSIFNLLYNKYLVVDSLTEAQQAAFWHALVPIYNTVPWVVGLALILRRLVPLIRCRWDLQAGRPVEPHRLERCRRWIVDLPAFQVRVIFLAWLGGAFFFPTGICLLGGWENGWLIWGHFALSFVVSALVSTTQTFFVQELFLIKVLYPVFFQDARPAEIRGVRRISLGWRLLLYWLAVGVVPMLTLLVVALNAIVASENRQDMLWWMSLGVAVVGIGCSGLISWVVGQDLFQWVRTHMWATEQTTLGHYDFRIAEKRPDELGQINDRSNDMIAGLERSEQMRETFGELLDPEIAEEIWLRDPGLEGQVVEVTVLFADIRGYTRRSTGMPPEQAVTLLNRFLSLAVAPIKQNAGLVNKFLGDGLMALFGVPRRRADHADMAVQAACGLLAGLQALNRELADEGQAPLVVGIGINTGPALVGSIGATYPGPDGRTRARREYTAIGEAINLGQRAEQLTKTVGGPILITEATRARLQRPVKLTCLGPQEVHGYEGMLVVHRVDLS